jgi:nucleoside-diphosphate-sugar epimerase
MRVFVAGGSGTIGMPLVRALVAAGHQVTALTRSPNKQQEIRDLGAFPAVADALDGEALKAVVVAARPTHVIHQLTALPKEGVRRGSEMAATNRLRIDGTRNLLNAAITAGARRIIVGSFAPMQGIQPGALPEVQAALDAVVSMENQILDASRAGTIEGIVLRYGLFYGPENPATRHMVELVRRRMLPVIRNDHGLLPVIHVDDAVTATVAALDHGTAGSVYNIVDNEAVSISAIVRALAEEAGARPPFAVPAWIPRLLAPYLAGLMNMQLALSNSRARTELHWQPVFPTWREGVSRMFVSHQLQTMH